LTKTLKKQSPYRRKFHATASGHHNHAHHIITHLNTRNFHHYSPRLLTAELGQTTHDKNPGPVFRTPLTQNRKNQYAHPDAPKPIHRLKEQFCSQQPSWEQTSNFSLHIPFAE
jgi:hypothetical protein